MNAIEIQNLTKEFNGKTVLKDISFEVNEGEIFGYLGPNGAGKTTTMRIILGLLNPTSGNAFVLGQNLGENEKLRNKVGVLLENDGVYDKLSGGNWLWQGQSHTSLKFCFWTNLHRVWTPRRR